MERAEFGGPKVQTGSTLPRRQPIKSKQRVLRFEITGNLLACKHQSPKERSDGEEEWPYQEPIGSWPYLFNTRRGSLKRGDSDTPSIHYLFAKFREVNIVFAFILGFVHNIRFGLK